MSTAENKNNCNDIEEIEMNKLIEGTLNKIKSGHCPLYHDELIGEDKLFETKIDHLNVLFCELLKFMFREILLNEESSINIYNLRKQQIQLQTQVALLKTKQSFENANNDKYYNEIYEDIQGQANVKGTEIGSNYIKVNSKIMDIINSNVFKKKLSENISLFKKQININENKLNIIFKHDTLPNIIAELNYYNEYYPNLYSKDKCFHELISNCLHLNIQNINLIELPLSYFGLINFLQQHELININNNSYKFYKNNNNKMRFNISIHFNCLKNIFLQQIIWSNLSAFNDLNTNDYLSKERIINIINHFHRKYKIKYGKYYIYGININKKKHKQYIKHCIFTYKLYDISDMIVIKKQPEFHNIISKIHGLIFVKYEIKKIRSRYLKTYPSKNELNGLNIDEYHIENQLNHDMPLFIDLISIDQTQTQQCINMNGNRNVSNNNNNNNNRNRSRSRNRNNERTRRGRDMNRNMHGTIARRQRY